MVTKVINPAETARDLDVLREEIAALRREIAELKRANGVHYHHHHAAPLPVIGPFHQPAVHPYAPPYWGPWPVTCDTADASRKYALPTAAGGGAEIPATLGTLGHNFSTPHA